MDSNLKPQVWGWVCLQRRIDEKPRLIRISSAMVAKIKAAGQDRLSCEKAMNARKKKSESFSKHQQKVSRNNLKNCTSKSAQPSSWSRKKKHSPQLVGAINSFSAGGKKSLHAKDMLMGKLE